MSTSRPPSRSASSPPSPIIISEHEKATRNDPLGSLLLNLAGKVNHLIENSPKGGLPLNYDALCQNFGEFSTNQNDKILSERKNVDDLTLDVQQNLLQKELGYAASEITINPPDYFSPTPTLTDPKRMSDVLKVFPTKSKFSNSSHNIIDHLSTINYAQAIANLSEPEFRNILPKCFGGAPFTHISEYITHSMPLSDIYFSLMRLYDNRDSPDEARKKLENIKIYKDTKFVKLLANITLLCSRIASILPIGESRTSLFNVEAISALLKILPNNSAQTITTHINSLQSKLGRGPTFIEVTKALAPFQTSIEKDFEQNGLSSRNSKNNFNISASTNQRDTTRRNFARRTVQRNEDRKVNIFFNTEDKNTPQGSKRPFNRNKNYTSTSQSSKNGKFCSLCGKDNHVAADGCFKMRLNGKQVTVIPSGKPCPNCLNIDGTRLFHPAKFCFRKNKPQ